MRDNETKKTRRAFLTAVGVIGATAGLGGGMTVQGQETPDDKKIYILNALWFKPDGGAERYAEYGRAVGPIVAKYGGRIDGRSYVPRQNLIGEFDADLVFFVEWPSLEAFQTFAQDPDLPAASSIRSDSITKSLLIQCDPAPAPV